MCIQKIQCSYEQKVSVLCRHSFGSSHNLSSPMNVGEERLCDESKEHLQKRLAKGPNVFLFCFCNSTSQSMTADWQKGLGEQESCWKNSKLQLVVCSTYLHAVCLRWKCSYRLKLVSILQLCLYRANWSVSCQLGFFIYYLLTLDYFSRVLRNYCGLNFHYKYEYLHIITFYFYLQSVIDIHIRDCRNKSIQGGISSKQSCMQIKLS